MKQQNEHCSPKFPIREFASNKTMYETIKSANQENQDFDAIGYMGHSIKYGELLTRVDRLAAAFALQDIKKGDIVPVCTLNTPEVAEILLALNKIGAVSNWIDLRSTDIQLIRYINEQRSTLFIGLDVLMPRLKNILDRTNLKKIILISSSPEREPSPLPDNRVMTYQKFAETGRSFEDGNFVSFEKNRPAIIIQSSGTTGLAKSIVHTDFSICNSIICYGSSDFLFYAGYTLLVTAPPWVAYGLINSYYLSLAFGMKAELVPQIANDMVYNKLGEFDICFAVPLHFRYIAANFYKIKNPDKILKRMKCFFVGGDKIDATELDNLEQLLRVPILNGYGCNEVLGGATVNPYLRNKHGSVGLPLGDNLVKAFDITTQEPLPDNIQGEICIKTNTSFKEYVNNPLATKEVKKTHMDGTVWVHTGDIGYTDKDGYVYVVGRLKRSIIRGAFKIFPGTIEQVISLHPAVKECVVVGVVDVNEGHVPMAHVVVKDGYSNSLQDIEKQLREICQKHLKDYERPGYYNFLKSIPYTANNKQDFRALEAIGDSIVKSFMN